MKSTEKPVDRTELLASTRTEFLGTFVAGIEPSMSTSLESLFAKAERSTNWAAQRRYLDARGILQNRFGEFQLQMQRSMEKMLNRSFQTTYSNYRPAFPTSLLDGSVSLVDTSAFEDELRLNEITDRFRNEAGEQLRDLNIRIALLFEQDDIRERENPFRPYLFSRTIASAVESLGASAELNTVLTEQAADDFSGHISAIYEAVNAHLARHGIAAQLLLKPKRTPSRPSSGKTVEARQGSDDRHFGDSEGVRRQEQVDEDSADREQRRQIWDGSWYNQSDIDSREFSSDVPQSPVERLLKSVRAMASRSMRRNDAANEMTQGGGSYDGGHSSGVSHNGGNSGGLEGKPPMTGNPALHAGTGDGPQIGAQAGAGPANASWISGAQNVGPMLRRFFSGQSNAEDFSGPVEQHGAESGKVRPAPGQLAGSVQILLRQNTPHTEEMYAENGDIRNLILERRTDLNEMAHDLREQMTIDIVSMLFEFILRDSQVPAEVRAQLGRLQFLVLKIALRDESLLTEKAHPARMLVNRIGSISLGLKQIDPSGANVTAEICRIVSEILADESESPGLFSKMLDDLDKFIAHELLVNDKNVAGAIEVVEQAESRTLRFAHATAQMSEALSGLTINEHLKQFLEHDWVRAIEHAERTNVELATQYRLLVPDLLWSVLPKIADEEKQQLLMLLPVILKTIHGGMAAVGWAATDKQTVMDWLLDVHTAVLRSNGANAPATSLSSIHSHFNKFVENTEKSPQAQVAVTPESHKNFLEEAMRELDVRIQLLDKLFDQDEDFQKEAVADAVIPPVELSIQERLRAGVGIEVNLGGKPSVGRLNWFNPNATNLVLTLNDQAEPSMISVRLFQRLLNQDRVRFLETEPIFERAIESLLISANQLA